MRSRAILCACLLATSGTSAARAQDMHDIDPQTMTAVVRYALPHMLQAVHAGCAANLPRTGYLATHQDALMAKFSSGADAQWPKARELLIDMSARDGGQASTTLAKLPDDALKPFVDGMIVQLVTQQLKPERCQQIERGLALLDPLPADNIAGLFGFLVEVAGKDRRSAAATTRSGSKSGD